MYNIYVRTLLCRHGCSFDLNKLQTTLYWRDVNCWVRCMHSRLDAFSLFEWINNNYCKIVDVLLVLIRWPPTGHIRSKFEYIFRRRRSRIKKNGIRKSMLRIVFWLRICHLNTKLIVIFARISRNSRRSQTSCVAHTAFSSSNLSKSIDNCCLYMHRTSFNPQNIQHYQRTICISRPI